MLNFTSLGKPYMIFVQTFVALHAAGTFTDFQRQIAYHNVQYSVTMCNYYVYISTSTF
jgi:hypothetical protein